jgi:hypothetical protein
MGAAAPRDPFSSTNIQHVAPPLTQRSDLPSSLAAQEQDKQATSATAISTAVTVPNVRGSADPQTATVVATPCLRRASKFDTINPETNLPGVIFLTRKGVEDVRFWDLEIPQAAPGEKNNVSSTICSIIYWHQIAASNVAHSQKQNIS